jgi:hypothetical protein
VDALAGDYICYVYLKTKRNDLYLDEFTLMDDDEQITYAASYKGVHYKSLDAALTKAAADGEGTVTMCSDVLADALTVALGVNLDLCGYDLQVRALASYGNVYDSRDGQSVLCAEEILLAQNNSQLPLFDSSLGGYRFFGYSLHNYGTKVRNDKVTFGFALQFANADAYSLLAQGDSGVELRVKLGCTGASEQTFGFDGALLQQYAALVQEYPGAGAALMLHVTGIDSLAAGSQVRVTPVVTTAIGTAATGSAMDYSAG